LEEGDVVRSLARPLFLVLFVLTGSTRSTCYGENQWGEDRFDLFGGISYHQEAVNGGNASLSFKLTPRFSLVADFSAHQESRHGSTSTDILHGIFGGQYAFGEIFGLEPFARMTTGVTRWEQGIAAERSSQPQTDVTGFVMGLGGGVDYSSAGLFKLRLLQVDYLTKPDWRSGADVRISFGIVASF
jgi:hypothetical protein